MLAEMPSICNSNLHMLQTTSGSASNIKLHTANQKV